MRTLLLSDVHANLPAFQSVLEDAGHWDRVIFLGDIANFGPYPAECVDLLRSLNPICIMGNHDYLIAGAWGKRNFFDQWSREHLGESQLDWMKRFQDLLVMDDGILAIHGAYNVDYDILPGIPDEPLQKAFAREMAPGLKTVLFGHYHYQIDREIGGIGYHCIRPAGHHRDRDVRAGYSLLEDGVLSHHRVPYDVERTIYATDHIPCLSEPFKSEWIGLLRCAFSDSLLKKDIETTRGYGT